MKTMYHATEHYGIYEVIRVDDNGVIVVVQTNIRTKEKAIEACKRWNERVPLGKTQV